MPAVRKKSKDRIPALSVAAGLAIAVYLAAYILIFSKYPYDDAYIHMRVARNISLLGAPYFNPGEPVMGSSPHLWINLIAGLFRLLGPGDRIVRVLEVLFAEAGFLAFVLFVRRRLGQLQSVLLAGLLSVVFVAPVAAGLMETPAAILFFTLSLFAMAEDAPAWAGFAASLAFLTRYEFALWLLIAFVFQKKRQNKWQNKWSARWRFAAGALPLCLVFLIYTMSYFGTIVPFPMIAKAKVYVLSFGEFLEHQAYQEVWEHVHYRLIPFLYWGWILAFWGGVGYLGWYVWRSKGEAWERACAVFGIAIFLVYFSTKTFMFQWYWPIFAVPLTLVPPMVFRGRSAKYMFVVLVAGFWAFYFQAFLDAAGLVSGYPQLYHEYAPGCRVRQYENIASDLKQAFPSATLMTPEIGAISWAFGGKIIDSAALVSPAILKYYPIAVPEGRPSGTESAIPPGAVQEFHPDLIASMEEFSVAFRREILSGRLTGYHLWKSYPVVPLDETARTGIDHVWYSKKVDVYVRDGVVPVGHSQASLGGP